MATQSFLTDFKFTAKSGKNILEAIENSKTNEHVFSQKVTVVKDKEVINKMMDSLLGARGN